MLIDLIPCPGPQIISVASTFLDPLTIDIQSSPSTNQHKFKHMLDDSFWVLSDWFGSRKFLISGEKIWRKFMGFNYVPVLMTEFLILMFCVPVTWIPSVFGLFPGAVTMRFKALTLIQFWNVRCICCAFLNHRFDTIKFLQSMKVTACKKIYKV